MADDKDYLLDVRGLSLSFPAENEKGDKVVLSDVSFGIRRGEILGIVGESGCGKTMTALAVAGLLPETARIDAGEIYLGGQDLMTLSFKERRLLLGKDIGMIFQEPLSALNPLMTIGRQLAEVLTSHASIRSSTPSRKEQKQTILRMLANVGFLNPARIFDAFPHQLSGGQRQRALIAGCLLLSPSLLIADEPTTALDTVTQAQILDQIRRISSKLNLSVLFISHNLLLVEKLCDRVAVMHDHRIIECDTPEEVLHHPKHPHTVLLLRDSMFTPLNTASADADLSKMTPLLEVKNLYAKYEDALFQRHHDDGGVLTDVSLSVYPGEIMGIVGTSGCGKTTLTRVITGLLPAAAGRIYENGELLADFSHRHGKYMLPSVGLVFQDPYSSLHPQKTIGWLLEEPLRVHHIGNKTTRRERAAEMMEDVGLPPEYMSYYPYQLSGGQRQRVAIAISLMLSPSLIIADEPVSALDVSMQTQILHLLWDIHEKKGTAFLFISHDLRVIRTLCSRVAVMDNGMIAESGTIDDVFTHPKHPATKNLLLAEESGSAPGYRQFGQTL